MTLDMGCSSKTGRVSAGRWGVEISLVSFSCCTTALEVVYRSVIITLL